MTWPDGSMTPAGLALAPVAEVIANKDNFFRAITDGCERAVKAFIEERPDCVNWTMDKRGIPYQYYNGGTGLMGAAIWENPNIADMLIKAGAKVDAQDKDGNTPLHRAFEERNVEVSEVLVKNNARPDIPNREGQTVMQMLGTGPVSQMIREKMQAEAMEGADEYGRKDPQAQTISAKKGLVQNVVAEGSITIEDVGPGTQIRNVTAKGDINISGIGKPKPH
jgi:hypothetical protein